MVMMCHRGSPCLPLKDVPVPITLTEKPQTETGHRLGELLFDVSTVQAVGVGVGGGVHW